MLAMVVDGLKKTGLKEFQVSIGHVDFIQSLFEATNLEDEQKEEIRTLIANRNFFGVEEILDHYEIADQVKEAFISSGTDRWTGDPCRCRTYCSG